MLILHRNALLENLSQQQAAKQGQNEIQASVDHLQEELKSQRLREEVAATRMLSVQC